MKATFLEVENVDGDRSIRRTYLSRNERGIDNPSESWDDFDVRSRGSSSFSGKGVIAGRSVLERFGKIRMAKRRERGRSEERRRTKVRRENKRNRGRWRNGASEWIRSRRSQARLARPRNELRSLGTGSYDGREGNVGEQRRALSSIPSTLL